MKYRNIDQMGVEDNKINILKRGMRKYKEK